LSYPNNIFKKAGIDTKIEEAKQTSKTLTELTESYKDLYQRIKGSSREAASTKKLWREGNKSRLIQIGMALIVLPEPTPVTPTIGACFIAAGAIQRGIKSRAIYMEDITKTLQSTLKEIVATKYNLQI
jgi:hypothetical protein